MNRSWPSPERAVLLVLAVLATACSGTPEQPAVEQRRISPITEVNWENDVRVETLAGSVHADLDCSECHAKNGGSAEKSFAGDVQCRGCHEKSEKIYDQSAHGRARSEGVGSAARCQDCHGAHDVYSASDPRSRVSKRRQAATCSKCHDNPELAPRFAKGEPARVQHYVESIHGDRLVKKGTVVAPSCVDCHGGHDIAKKDEPASRVNLANVGETCGSCHEGITKKYAASAHGAALAEGKPDSPACTSCHSAHSIAAPEASFKLASDRQCGKCHEQRLSQHLGTYHGRAHALGGTSVAACFDCHGSHDVFASDDPRSKLAPARRIETCRSCHEDAPPKLAGYLAHGDPGDRSSYPLLYWTERPIRFAMLAAVGLCALHALCWLLRTLLVFLQSPREYRLRVARQERERLALVAGRFRSADRLAWVLLVVALGVLVGTGMPLKFHQTAWAHQLFGLLGGADTARALHRLGALMVFSAVFVHLARLFAAVWRVRGELRDEAGRFDVVRAVRRAFRADSPLPGPSDLGELWRQLRWFLGKGPAPEARRFHFWEKLDYLALALGIAVVAFTGLALWAPELVTVLLPGWVINVAHAIHSEEALLVIVLLAFVHLVHLWPKRTPSKRAAKKRVSTGPEVVVSR